MSAAKVLDQYFAEFNRHDAQAVARLFGTSGTYVDPAVPEGVSGPALESYLAGHYRAFPDARYEIVKIASGDGGLVACEWLFTGTNSGPFGKLPPTKRSVRVPGASMLQVDGQRIVWLHGYFDRRSMLRQLQAGNA